LPGVQHSTLWGRGSELRVSYCEGHIRDAGLGSHKEWAPVAAQGPVNLPERIIEIGAGDRRSPAVEEGGAGGGAAAGRQHRPHRPRELHRLFSQPRWRRARPPSAIPEGLSRVRGLGFRRVRGLGFSRVRGYKLHWAKPEPARRQPLGLWSNLSYGCELHRLISAVFRRWLPQWE